MVLAIDDSNIDWQFGQEPGRFESTKSSSDDHHAMPFFLHVALRHIGRASERYIDSGMGEKSELFYGAEVGDSWVSAARVETKYRRDLLEIAVVFGCILVAVWTPPGRVNAFFSIVAAACVVAF